MILSQISIGCAIIVYVYCTCYYRFQFSKNLDLSEILKRVIAAGMIPTAIALILIPVVPNIDLSLKDFGLQIAIAGLVLLHYFSNIVFHKFE